MDGVNQEKSRLFQNSSEKNSRSFSLKFRGGRGHFMKEDGRRLKTFQVSVRHQSKKEV
jgi:hypothetical protein